MSTGRRSGIFVLGILTSAALLPGMARSEPDLSSVLQRWVARYNGPGSSFDDARALAVSPDGSRVYVAGASSGSGTSEDYATVAYDAAAGTQLWAARYNGPANSGDRAADLAVSPDGARVYVTGFSFGVAGTSFDYATVTYDAASGTQLWTARYNGPANSYDLARGLAVSPDGSRVYVAGSSDGIGTSEDYATVAYDAAAGTQLWAARYNGPANSSDRGGEIAVSPDGSRVYVAGSSDGIGTSEDYATVTYDAASGTQLWTARYNGPANSYDLARGLAVSPDGSRVYVAGSSYGIETSDDYATVAYDAEGGTQIWAARYDGEVNSWDWAQDLAVSPDGTQVYATGSSYRGTSFDYATVAYDAASGTQLWDARYNELGNSIAFGNSDLASAITVSPDGARVYVTGFSFGVAGTSFDYATVTYDAASGTQLWTVRYNGPANSGDRAADIAVSPDGARVYVTGYTDWSATGYDYATVAYCTLGTLASPSCLADAWT